MSDTFMCCECNENCHGAAEDFTICNACRIGFEAEIARLQSLVEKQAAEIDEYQQEQDEIIVALGSRGILPSEIVGEITRLQAKNENLKAEYNWLKKELRDQAKLIGDQQDENERLQSLVEKQTAEIADLQRQLREQTKFKESVYGPKIEKLQAENKRLNLTYRDYIEAGKAIEKLQARIEVLEAAAKYACAEWRICWDRAIVTIDCNHAHRDLQIAAEQEE